MGQKVHPIGFRLGVIRSWESKWYEERNYAKWLHEDIKLREFVKEKLGQAGISKIEIERAANKVKINVHTARPGIVIGKRGAGIETIKKDLQALTVDGGPKMRRFMARAMGRAFRVEKKTSHVYVELGTGARA